MNRKNINRLKQALYNAPSDSLTDKLKESMLDRCRNEIIHQINRDGPTHDGHFSITTSISYTDLKNEIIADKTDIGVFIKDQLSKEIPYTFTVIVN